MDDDDCMESFEESSILFSSSIITGGFEADRSFLIGTSGDGGGGDSCLFFNHRVLCNLL